MITATEVSRICEDISFYTKVNNYLKVVEAYIILAQTGGKSSIDIIPPPYTWEWVSNTLKEHGYRVSEISGNGMGNPTEYLEVSWRGEIIRD
jgi:hypothetical protein